ncbi:T9SS type B sorting domain-containing protein [Flavobacterium sp. GT3R68]|uniref:T9SS type B sorting domain-containing protein n=1 Tax=Flavobacterium sp. GT3R68 TaxID=2594437 RepID=UPI000F86820D|nr:choice-of-anchor L domain-containing protein [Flavobacterium sp. GT3R68]RTY95749.1 T9SS type B sorting domain-containing protein [Flavobacterium sp. GSN2]TRW93520.1 T9SS type B sorting domain-containing protein [Flavobacterium sp. GT3R68]
MRNSLSLLLLLFSIVSFSQGIVVDTTALSIPQLVENQLMPNSCSDESNFVFSSHRSIGQFTNTNPSFPFANGVIIRNGIAKYTEGPYNATNESSQINNAGDADLQAVSNSNGQTAPIIDAAFLQFDFTPLSSNFSFEFLFASNEYGEYQCGFSDVFIFLLTDLTSGTTTNLAVIPGTTTPVSVLNIRDAAYNSSCISANPNLFSRYNVTNPAGSAINMRGQTVLLSATSPVIPNRTYRIKLAIGDYNDTNYDSAVFIKGGSFNTTTNLGPDQAMCQGESFILNSGLGPQYTYEWTLNNTVLINETNATLTVTQPGTYGVKATTAGCEITDQIVFSDLQTNTPVDVKVCNKGQATYQFDLTTNNLTSLGIDPANYSIMYFANLANANANGPQIPAGQLNSYTSAGNQTIYIKVTHLSNGNFICDNLLSFRLVVKPNVTATAPPPLRFCSNTSVPVNLLAQNTPILNGQSQADFILTYFTSQSDAQNNTNAIASPNLYPITPAQSPQTFWVRVEENSSLGCFTIVSFIVNVFPEPLASDIADVIECSNYTLPAIANGNYYTGPNGTGTLLNAGDVISTNGTYYIYSGPLAPGNCTAQNSFVATFIDELDFEDTACGEYIIAAQPAGDFYTGASGTGTLLTPGTVLSTSQTIFYYGVINGVVCRDEALPITVFPLPPVDDPADVITCNSYTLPGLTNGNYFTGSRGSGTPLNTGDLISTTQDVYVFADDGTCTNENVVTINIIDPSIYQPVDACGSFILPAITVGGYFDLPSGGGNPIPAGTAIMSSQTVYYYAVVTVGANCTDNLNYAITIFPLPPVDTPPIYRLECQSYTLPQLTNGNYFTETGGVGPLNAGDIITTSQTIYIYAVGGGCTNEHAFEVEIRELPLVDSFTNVFTCSDFTLPALVNGTYYTAIGGPSGTGSAIAPGTVISTSQIIYIYNEWPDLTTCSNESRFTVEASGVEVGTFADVAICDSYTLRPLTVGNYYSQPGGLGPSIPPGTVLTSSQTVYVYAIKGNRLTCTDEDDFIVSISQTPNVTSPPDIEKCGDYILPPLAVGNYFAGPNGTLPTYAAGQSIASSQTMYVYAVSPTNPNCWDQEDFNIVIHPMKDLVIRPGVICVDFLTGELLSPAQLNSGLNPAIYTVEWYLNGVLIATGPDFTATQEGTYDVKIIKNTPDIGDDCGYNTTTVIVEKSSIAIATATATGAFEENIDIIVTVTGGFGTYVYQLGDGNFQTDNVFYNVPSGEHIITIRDTKGDCGDIRLTVIVLHYPNYFTPNGDNYHDTWNIPDLDDQTAATIFIFDRYGKFLKQISPAGAGWDGTLNGQQLPSSDYWFQVFYKNEAGDQEFRAHFSLKR